MVCLFTESYKKYYYAPWLSMPTCVVIFCIIGVILVPFFIQFGRINFWGETASYFEQATVSITNHYIIQINNEDYSTFSQRELEEIIFYSDDSTFDGKDDIIIFNGTLPITDTDTSLKYLRVMLFFNFEIKKEIERSILVMASMEFENLEKGSTLYFKGNLLLHQNEPFDYPDVEMFNRIKDNYFQENDANDIEKIYEDFTFNRSQMTKYDYSTIYQLPSNSPENIIKINAEIHIPKQQKIIYRRPPYINLKFRWIEFLALFIPIVFIVYSIISFMFRYQLVECSVISSIPKSMS